MVDWYPTVQNCTTPLLLNVNFKRPLAGEDTHHDAACRQDKGSLTSQVFKFTPTERRAPHIRIASPSLIGGGHGAIGLFSSREKRMVYQEKSKLVTTF
eukprot:scaffold2881_cov45-Attheya_sp.AAC.5